MIHAFVLIVIFEIAGRILGKAVGRLLRKSKRFNANEKFLHEIIAWVLR